MRNRGSQSITYSSHHHTYTKASQISRCLRKYNLVGVCFVAYFFLQTFLAITEHNRIASIDDKIDSNACSFGPLHWVDGENGEKSGIGAIFTPYPLIPGGGERYLLTFAKALQRYGLDVHILVLESNPVTTTGALYTLCKQMGMNLKPMNVHIVHRDLGFIQDKKNEYDVFLSLGNEKFPQVAGIGFVNFYMCQFPFDLGRIGQGYETRNLLAYDYVLLNSRFSFSWYNEYLSRGMDASLYSSRLPEMTVLYPPVSLQKTIQRNPESKENVHIILLGRFFEGRQSKGHEVAIEMFKQIKLTLKFKSVILTLAGSQMRDREEDLEYTKRLQRMAATENLRFLIDYSDDELQDLLISADIIWHLTGIKKGHKDPASEEHFGISVALAMGYGIVPVVFQGGAMQEIVDTGINGFVCKKVSCIMLKTIELVQDPITRNSMGSLAHQKSKQFSEDVFLTSAVNLIHRATMSKPFRYLVQRTSTLVHGRSFILNPRKTRNHILLIEPRIHYALEYVLKNALYHLDSRWGVTVVHGILNRDFVWRIEKSIRGMRRIEIPVTYMDVSHVNRLLTSSSFWEYFRDFDRVLMIQTDGLLLHGNLDRFLKYDYIGAPWHRENERWGKLSETIPEGVGNGGMSLRSPKAMLRVLHQYKASGQEDLFYMIKMVGDNHYTLPERQVAFDFAREVPCSDLNTTNLPVMIHAYWYYWQGPALHSALEKSICG